MLKDGKIADQLMSAAIMSLISAVRRNYINTNIHVALLLCFSNSSYSTDEVILISDALYIKHIHIIVVFK